MIINGKIIAASGAGVVLLCGGSYFAGRKSVHPNTEIQYKEHIVYQEDTKKEEQIIADKVKSQVKQIVEQKTKELEESYKKKINTENKGEITITTKTTIDPITGAKVVTQTKVIDYDKKKSSNTKTNTHTKKTDEKKTDTKTEQHEHKEDTKKEEEHKKEDKTIDEKVKQTYPNSGGIDYTFLIGRSFNDTTTLDYMGQVGVPLPFFRFIKADIGYEWHDKRLFIGATINY